MSDSVQLSRRQNIGMGVFLVTSALTALNMGGFMLNLQLGLPVYLVVATLGGVIGGALMATDLPWAGAIAGAIAAPCGLLVLAWWVTGRERVYSIEVVLIEMIAAGIPGGLVFFGFHSIAAVRGRVTLDDNTITYQSPNGPKQTFSWADLEAVEIEATAKIFGSLHYVLKGANAPVRIPENAKGFAALRNRLEDLPGWDNEALISALGATASATFVAWRKQG